MEEKKSSKIIYIILILIIIVLSGALGYTIYQMENIKNTESNTNSINSANATIETTNKTDDLNNSDTLDNTKSETTTMGKSGEQMIFSKMGRVFISDEGDVYFEPTSSADIMGQKVDVQKYAKDSIGNPSSYEIESDKFMEGHYTFTYKLDLKDVLSVSEYNFGNGGINYSLLFIHKNGNISELSLQASGENGDLKLFKNISGYSNIVSSVVDSSEDGVSVKLFDRNGNGKSYITQSLNDE